MLIYTIYRSCYQIYLDFPFLSFLPVLYSPQLYKNIPFTMSNLQSLFDDGFDNALYETCSRIEKKLEHKEYFLFKYHDWTNNTDYNSLYLSCEYQDNEHKHKDIIKTVIIDINKININLIKYPSTLVPQNIPNFNSVDGHIDNCPFDLNPIEYRIIRWFFNKPIYRDYCMIDPDFWHTTAYKILFALLSNINCKNSFLSYTLVTFSSQPIIPISSKHINLVRIIFNNLLLSNFHNVGNIPYIKQYNMTGLLKFLTNDMICDEFNIASEFGIYHIFSEYNFLQPQDPLPFCHIPYPLFYSSKPIPKSEICHKLLIKIERLILGYIFFTKTNNPEFYTKHKLYNTRLRSKIIVVLYNQIIQKQQ